MREQEMSLRVLAVVLAAMLLPTPVLAEKSIDDRFLNQLLRLTMPAGAACADADLGAAPNCTYKNDFGQVVAEKTPDGLVRVSVTFPDVNQGAANLEGVLVRIAVGFGFSEDQVHTCVRTGVHDFAVRRHQAGYDSSKEAGWGPGVAEMASVTDYTLTCRAWKPDVSHIDIVIAAKNSL
jgi:hypothetical protein